ncbi:uncharacterized protein LOC144703387 [Wolffia australiana]
MVDHTDAIATMEKRKAKVLPCILMVTRNQHKLPRLSPLPREELGDGYFCLVVDEARCEARKEWMSVVLRFVDQHGEICERFAGAIHVEDTRSETLFQHLLGFVHCFGLDIKRLRGQAYDGASNMRGEFNGLQALVRSHVPFAFYVHCFTHWLNLVIVAVATEVHSIAQFFCSVQHIFNICGASCKWNDALRSFHAEFIQKPIELGDVVTGKGKNQMRSLGSISSTRWNCRLSAVKSIANLFSAICDVLEMVVEDVVAHEKRVEADHLLEKISSFEFTFGLMLMTEVLIVTNTLSSVRDEGFPGILDRSVAFSFLHGIVVPPLDEQWQPSGRRMRGRPPQSRELSYKDHYRLEVFIPVLDQLRSELDCRFSETVDELMDLASCLQPNDNFHRFDCQKILRLAKVYSEDFSDVDRLGLESKLRSFKSTLISHPDFGIELNSITDLLPIVIKSGLSVNFPLCTRLIRLILTLPVSTATTEQSFSALKIVKIRLRTSMGDSWLVDLITIYIEKGIARNIPIDNVVSGFSAMKSRRV